MFPDKEYVNLEAPDYRALAESDPRGFLNRLATGAILDEVQRVPSLLSYIQVMVDENRSPGRFVLTGSSNFHLMESVSQSLAGRAGVLELAPLSLSELPPPLRSAAMEETLFRGFYPAVAAGIVQPGSFFRSYVATYVERDVRMLLNVESLLRFQTFLRLCAGRTGQILNVSDLARDAGISHMTAGNWLSVLEASYLIFRVPFHAANYSKRLVKAPKLYFLDSGLACHLIGIEEPRQLETHPLRGALFESMVAADLYKQSLNLNLSPRLFHYRDAAGLEVDLILETGVKVVPIEIKSAQTTPTAAELSLGKYLAQTKSGETGALIHGGDFEGELSEIRYVPFRMFGTFLKDIRSKAE